MLTVCGHYRRMAIKHITFVDSFRDLLEAGANWTERHSKVFDELKINMENIVTLSHYIPDKTFKV